MNRFQVCKEFHSIDVVNLFSDTIEYPLEILYFYVKWDPLWSINEKRMQKLERTYKSYVNFCKIDCDENTVLQHRHGVLCSPTFVVLKSGVKVGTFVGTNFVNLEKFIKLLINVK